MKGTHPQPRSPRRTAFRAGFRTGLRAGRRVIMWAALVMAVAIGVVWAGGERTKWWTNFETPWHEPNVVDGFDFTRSVLFVSGRSGGMSFRHETFDSRSASLPGFALPVQRWWPTWAGRWPVNCALRIPYWIPMALCLTTFALLFRVERREKQLARAGHCVCGYSLAGLADGAVCPECGKGMTLT